MVVEQGQRWMTTNRFSIVLREDFRSKMIIPCFARIEVLEMLQVPVLEQPTIIESNLQTEEHFNFPILIKNENDQTFFSCRWWQRLAKAYEDQHVHHLSTRSSNWAVFANYSSATPSYFNMSRETRRIVDRRHVTPGTTLTWQELHIVVEFVASIEDRILDAHAGLYNGSFVPFVHMLNKSNVKKKPLKLP